ncbi:MAG: sulfite exporter TauE/SafE family protein [Gammaproteobacteria bacterium]|nr:MAG: sulfite exporter TauE/SafE family protein [Gammaproteobacteria bacterium]
MGALPATLAGAVQGALQASAGWWPWLAAPLIGLSLGLFGAGGGMLTVPLLVYGAGLPLKQAVAMSVWLVAGVSLVAAVHQRAWRVMRPGLLAFFGVGGILGGVAGAWLGARVPDLAQQLLFGALLLVVAAWTLRAPLREALPLSFRCRCGLALLAGAGLGVLTGLLGVGGGFLMVPVLIALGLAHLPTAVAHSLVLIVGNALAAGLTYLGEVPLDLGLLTGIGGLAALGAVVGSHLLHRLPQAPLQKGFSVALALLGAVMLGQGLAAALS